MKLKLAAILIALTSVVAFVVACANQPNYRSTTLGDVRLLANLGLLPGSDATYFSIRVGDRKSGFSGEPALALSFRGSILPLASITPADVIQLGGNMSTVMPGSGFIGWGKQNREGGIGFFFHDGELKEFYARWHLPGPSEFAIVFPNNRSLRFPCNDEQLRQICGEGVVVEDFWGK